MRNIERRKAIAISYDSLPIWEALSCEQRGRLITALLEYGVTGEDPIIDDAVLKIAYVAMKLHVSIISRCDKKFRSVSSCGVYKYIYEGEIIYAGKSDSSIGSRIRGHSKESRFQPFLTGCEIYYADLPNPAFTTIYETYLINKYKPMLNTAMKYADEIPFDLPELDWRNYNDI